MTDLEALQRACELAAGGYPAPNPHVGCVILRGSEVVGEGF
ncbi:MAG TPA: bifunctional diaminohydroxyphosphoribosylaminopyrimidine deaminase/5-amino-6-(5-phosphoribosylamino)uracil reductase, partial [Armatimonadetes bacterium]|nr:bifunctional diaminohydroxyphosphoribosylaminopyrimidine deaminase/5-amino-6-(5-phosphoribosylamino)uracil reductase [Armatimonadota bacterium]